MLATLESNTKYRPGLHPFRPASFATPRRILALRPVQVQDTRLAALARARASLMGLLEVTRPRTAMAPAAPSPRIQAARQAAQNLFRTQSQTFPQSSLGQPNERTLAFQSSLDSIFAIQATVRVRSSLCEPAVNRRQSMLDKIFRTQGYSFPRSAMSRPENQ